jgi:3-hydroxyacyl-[acyl-carrier-protein] dehydratase
MLASDQSMIELIPQRPPMVMVHHLLTADETSATTQLEIQSRNIFVENGLFTEPGLVENIAQTAAAQIGYICKQKHIPVPVGYIAAIKDLKIYELPAVGDSITTTITIKNNILDITLVDGVVTLHQKELCRCEMRIFIKS